MIDPVLPYLWYPLLVGGAIAAFGSMLAFGFSVPLATYAPIALTALAILSLERRFPERLDWRPRRSDVKADAAFMTIVQIALPRALAAVSVFAISEWTHRHLRSAWWPHGWPLAAQIVAMVFAVDFARYWLHRACHRFTPLWKLHEVHHSPDILYALNVGRFHPVEKSLQFCIDSVPFLLLGVRPEVTAGYFLVYSVNGFLQHSNLRVRHGWLNYVVGSAETHRWHHACDPKTASCNFGNTTIVFDVLFGTWYLPKDKPVNHVGIMDKAYPKGFCAQMLAPFESRQRSQETRTLRRWFADTMVVLHLRLIRLLQERRMAKAARDPMRAQRRLLARILLENRNTTFGGQHAFMKITSYEQFSRHVPVAHYESLRMFVEAEMDHGARALTMEPPVQYLRTSGTTGQPKDVPLTRSHLGALRRIQRASVAFQYRACPQGFAGSILAIVSPAIDGWLPNGKPFASASGVLAASSPGPILEKFAIPAAVLTVSDSRVKYLLILRLALARTDITYIGSANSTTLLALIKLYREHASALIDDLRRGTFFLADKVPQGVWSAVRTYLRPSADRAAALAQLQASSAPPRIADLWPDLRLVVTWTCASAGIATAALRRELAERTRILELGYLSTEFRGTITVGRRPGTGWPTLDTHFFEFAEREQWDRGDPQFLTLDRIRKGVDYYVIVTTPSGLYRYFINDLVRVTGFLHKTPLLKFVQKGKGVTNITGEKLYESQVLTAVRLAMTELECVPRFLMMLADDEARHYKLYAEIDPGPRPEARLLAGTVDRRLTELNIEYAAKRESARLGAMRCEWLAGDTGERYKRFCVERGQREGQFKTVSLAYRKEFTFDLDACVDAPSS